MPDERGEPSVLSHAPIEPTPSVRQFEVPRPPVVGALPLSAPEPPRRRRRWLIPTIVASSVIVFALLATGVVGIVSGLARSYLPDAPDQPLTVGEFASPVAAEALQCPPACFVRLSMRETVLPDRALRDLGVPNVTEPFGTWDATTAGILNRSDSEGWAGYLQPDACFFIPTIAPYTAASTLVEWHSVDPVMFTGTYEDQFGNLADQSVRLFPDSRSAELYLGILSRDIHDCDEVVLGPIYDRYYLTVDPAVSINPPRSVAAVGWVATGKPGPGWRTYVYDLQRGNMVMRLRLYSDGSITEQDFRRVVQFAAAQLASIPTAEPTETEPAAVPD